MLQTIREKTSGWIAGVVLGLIIFAMAFFGIEHYFQARVETYAARIMAPPAWWPDAPSNALVKSLFWEEHEIGADEFRSRFEQYRQLSRERMGEAYDPTRMDSIESKREVLDVLIDRRIQELAAERDGIRIAKEQVRDAILDVEGLTQDGQFIGADAYRIWLQSRGLTAQGFEAELAADLRANAMPQGIRDTAIAAPSEIDAFFKLQRETRDIRTLTIEPPAVADAPVDDAALEAWYTAHAARFRIEETATIAYVEVDAASLSIDEVPGEAELRQRYEEASARFGSAEERDAAHILIALAKDADAAAVAAAEAKAAEVLAKARAEGADFAALAAEYSDDVGSKDMGGDLGAIGRDIYPKPFEDAVYGLAEGAISDPVRTDDGLHVIKLTRLVAGSQRPFEEVRAELEAEVVAAARERRFSEITGQLTDAVLLDPSSLEAAARAVGLEIRTSGTFGRESGEGVAAVAAVRRAAFDPVQLQDRQVSDPVEIAPNHVVVLQVVEHTPASTRPLADVREEAIAGWRSDERDRVARERAEALLARAREGESLDALATELGSTVVASPGLPRGASLVDAAVAREAFRLLPIESGKPIDAGLAKLDAGRYALVVVDARHEGDLSTLTDEIRGPLLQQFAAMRGDMESSAFVAALREQFEIEVAEERL